MKLSISVPDNLWKQAQEICGTSSPSKIVQRALLKMVGEQDDEIAEIWEEHPFLAA